MLGVRGVLRFVTVVAGGGVLAAAGGLSDAAAGPSVPTITSITVTATTATLTWKASTGVGRMLYNVDLNHAYQETVHGATSWTLTGLACSTVYTFQVQAIDSTGARSIATKLGVTARCSPARVGGRLVPATGVLFGGYVHPAAAWTQRGVTAREALLGRSYAIDAHVIGFGVAAPVSTLRWDITHGRHPLLTVGGRRPFPGGRRSLTAAKTRTCAHSPPRFARSAHPSSFARSKSSTAHGLQTTQATPPASSPARRQKH